jgi:hypothetical protein
MDTCLLSDRHCIWGWPCVPIDWEIMGHLVFMQGPRTNPHRRRPPVGEHCAASASLLRDDGAEGREGTSDRTILFISLGWRDTKRQCAQKAVGTTKGRLQGGSWSPIKEVG